MDVNTLSQLLDRELRHLHNMETRRFDALAGIGRRVTMRELADHVRRERALTVWHRERLRSVPRANGLELGGESCPGLGALLRDSESFIERVRDANLRDVAVVAALRRIGAFGRTYYETARRHAELLDEPVAAEILQRNLDDEDDSSSALDVLEKQLVDDEDLAEPRRSA